MGGGFVYTKNEAFDDLLEILRNSGELPTSSAESAANSAAKFSLSSGGFGSTDAANFNTTNGIDNWCFEQFVDQTQGKTTCDLSDIQFAAEIFAKNLFSCHVLQTGFKRPHHAG